MQLGAPVAGASSGIGATHARALRARGERLILVARREDRLTQTEFLDVAGTHQGLRVTRTPMLTPSRSWRIRSRAWIAGRLRVVTGRTSRLAVFAQRFLPASVPRRVAAELHRPSPEGERST